MPADVDALNYPYIRIREVEWLKKTLLLFPHVARMTPSEDAPNDDPEVQRFCWESDRMEALLRPADLWAGHVNEAQHQLVDEMQLLLDANGPAFFQRFKRESLGSAPALASDTWTRRTFDQSTTQIHDGKMLDRLTNFLVFHDLAWRPDPAHADGKRYLEMSSPLGEAVMATLAVACAEDEGCQVVTEFPKLHGRLIGTPRKEILRACLNPPEPSGATSGKQIAEFIIYRRCNVARVNASNFAEIVHERRALADFRAHMEQLAATLPPTMFSEEKLEQRLNDLSNDIFRNWREEQPGFGSVGKRLLGEDPLKEPGKLVETLVNESLKGGGTGALGAIAAHTGAIGLATGAAAGFALAVVFKGLDAWRQTAKDAKGSPLRYLSTLQKHGVTFTLTAQGNS
jgi:hypothetical protein